MHSTHAGTAIRQSVDPPPFIIGDTPYFDPFDATSSQDLVADAAENEAATARTTKIVVHVAFVGLLGLLALAQAPWWGHLLLGSTWIWVDQVA